MACMGESVFVYTSSIEIHKNGFISKTPQFTGKQMVQCGYLKSAALIQV
jgi:hypothetical protein